MNAVIEDTQYLSMIKFSNAVRKAGVQLNIKTGFQRQSHPSINEQLNVDGTWTFHNKNAVWFSFRNLSLTDAQKLHAAGFECKSYQIRNLTNDGFNTIVCYAKSAK